MSVIIEGMQMPSTCIECMRSGLRTAIHCEKWSEIEAGRREEIRSPWCLLHEYEDDGDPENDDN